MDIKEILKIYKNNWYNISLFFIIWIFINTYNKLYNLQLGNVIALCSLFLLIGIQLMISFNNILIIKVKNEKRK